MREREEIDIDCPYCGERIGVLLDPSEAGQTYTEDCQVCCRPIIVSVEASGLAATVRREDE